MYVYGSYRKMKTGIPLFGPLCSVLYIMDDVRGTAITADSDR